VTQLAVNDVNERITAARDKLSRLVLRAPAQGTVLNIAYRTTGSAIRPGDPLLDIVPEGESMVVEAKMNLRDIDSVRVGADTKVRLTAYNARVLAPLDGRIVYVAADRTVDEQSDQSYYVVRAEILPEALAAHPQVQLYPGMPAELLTRNRPRKAIDYLLEPITLSFNRAFRED
jgi:HlyD family secretion protein